MQTTHNCTFLSRSQMRKHSTGSLHSWHRYMDGKKKQTKTKWGENGGPLHIQGCIFVQTFSETITKVEWTFFLQRMWRVLEWHWTAVWPLTNMSVPFAVLLLCTSGTLERFVIFWLNLSLKTAARLVTRTNRDDHITPVLKGLHWLPVQERIMFKILLLTYRTIHGSAPSYLSELVSSYTPSRSLRSSSKNLLCRRKTKLLQYGDRSFFSAALKLWNELPDSVRKCETLDVFKSALKKHLFCNAYL